MAIKGFPPLGETRLQVFKQNETIQDGDGVTYKAPRAGVYCLSTVPILSRDRKFRHVEYHAVRVRTVGDQEVPWRWRKSDPYYRCSLAGRRSPRKLRRLRWLKEKHRDIAQVTARMTGQKALINSKI